MSGKIDPDAVAGEAEIRTDERDRIMLTLAILMLPDHDYLFDQVKSAIERLPPSPLGQAQEPGEDTLPKLLADLADLNAGEAAEDALREAAKQITELRAQLAAIPPPQVDSGREEIARAAKEFVDSALRWHEVFDDGRGGNNLTIEQTSDLISKRLALALRPERGGRE